MSFHSIQSEVIDIQGIYTLAVYFHYFLPGTLKIQSKVYTIPLGRIRELIDDSIPDLLQFENTRRWLPKGEAPFPGYCRAPGSARCVPTLCNCKKLQDVWNNVIIDKLKKKNESNQKKYRSKD
ncbi:hypothetical protein PYW08_005560 [Mythimna loreyi]|uniref:Uncharacterized protein n=1 Tax=Mythimna loreyi TaxID=667449 RepID=A0ACC2QI47_9NEOP|nr:hypothetical protein PYW08_005560 [Mythimna loreyi]